MLSDPGSRFCWSLALFRQLDVGPAHPAVSWVLGYTLFSCFLLHFYFYHFCLFCLFVIHVSLHSLGPLGFLCLGYT